MYGERGEVEIPPSAPRDWNKVENKEGDTHIRRQSWETRWKTKCSGRHSGRQSRRQRLRQSGRQSGTEVEDAVGGKVGDRVGNNQGGKQTIYEARWQTRFQVGNTVADTLGDKVPRFPKACAYMPDGGGHDTTPASRDVSIQGLDNMEKSLYLAILNLRLSLQLPKFSFPRSLREGRKSTALLLMG